MKLVIITSRLPDILDKGDKLRIFHQIKHLSKFHEIHLISLSSSKEHLINKDLERYIKKIHLIEISNIDRLLNLFYYTIIKNLPAQVAYFYSKKAQRNIDDIIKKTNPDWIYSQLIRTSEYVKSKPYKKLIDYMDSFSLGLKRRSAATNIFTKMIINFEYRRVKKYENHIFDYFDIHTIISEFDRTNIDHKKKKNIFIIKNGVDTDYFKKKKKNVSKNIILFVGNMSYKPNVLAAKFICKKIFPLVKVNNPKCKVLIAGSSPNREVKSLSKLDENIIVTGFLPDIRDAYEKADIFVAPMLIGSGLQNKILEAMSMKIPCITTEITNRSINANKDQVIIANTAKSFSDYCLELFNNSEKASVLAENGCNFVKSNFDWKILTEELNRLLK